MIFTKQKVKKLRKEYDKAIKNKKEEFVFEGVLLLTSYSKYLLEYLEGYLTKSK